MDEINRLRQRIEFVLRSNSLRNTLRRYYYKLPEDVEDDTVGWTLTLIKQWLPDIEIYVDELARAIAMGLMELGTYSEDIFIDTMTEALTETILHELIHYHEFILDEDVTEGLVSMLLQTARMGWHYVPCPKRSSLVGWEECAACNDSEKHPNCPLQRIRQDAAPRKYVPRKYHVTELNKVRYSFYERFHPYVRGWDEYWAMFFGKAVGWYIANLYNKESREFEFEVSAPALAEFHGETVQDIDDFMITGHGDIVDEEGNLVFELKVQHNLKYVRGAPNPFHVWQIQAYYTLGLVQFPELFGNVKQMRIVYFGRMWRGQSMPAYKEHVVPMETIDLLTPARLLRITEDTGAPPSLRCPDWLCKQCPHKALCDEDEGWVQA